MCLVISQSVEVRASRTSHLIIPFLALVLVAASRYLSQFGKKMALLDVKRQLRRVSMPTRDVNTLRDGRNALSDFQALYHI